MTPKPMLPSIQSLEAFLQIAKGANVNDAAAQLHLTASAVSRRLQNLEHALGVALLDRRGPRLQLTKAGAAYAENIAPILAALRKAGSTLSVAEDAQLELRIQSSPSFYSNLIAPRLWRFQEEWPHAVISLLTKDDSAQAADISIRPSAMDEKVEGEMKLLDFFVTPLCRRDLLEKFSVVDPRDLLKVPLIENLKRPNGWSRWFAEVDINDVSPARRVIVDSSFTAHDAVIGGAGAALFPSLYAKTNLDSNLICPFSHISVYSGSAFLSVHNDRPLSKAFRDWMLDVVVESTTTI